MPSLLSLSPSPHTTLFRAIVQLISRDTTIKRVVNPENIQSYQGIVRDTSSFSEGSAPSIRFTPSQGDESWFTPSGFKGNLIIRVEMFTKGTSADDAFNLWWAIKRAIYPKTPDPWPPDPPYTYNAFDKTLDTSKPAQWHHATWNGTPPVPPTPSMVISGFLQGLGMHTLPTFSRLVFLEPITTTHMHCAAQLACEVREDLNL